MGTPQKEGSTMKLAITCTTYNRPGPMAAQLKEVFRQLEYLGWDAEILVVNDGSLRSYKKVEKLLNDAPYATQYDRFNARQGKRRHWIIVRHIFRWLKGREWDYVIYMQDDLILERDFLEQVVQQFEAIKTERVQQFEKVCLNYVLEESRNRVKVWTPLEALDITFGKLHVLRVGWVELHFIANRKFFEVLDWDVHRIDEARWAKDKTLSSGVGRQLSHRLFRARKTMWQVTKSLATHGIYKSHMNPIERERNQLKSI